MPEFFEEDLLEATFLAAMDSYRKVALSSGLRRGRMSTGWYRS